MPTRAAMRSVMVQGTSSWAGKSLLSTALCRLIARRGLSVAPFKAQNMSNNARVVAGGEIGSAQWLQARAAGVEPDVRMNPVLVKPEGDRRSQVVLMGRADLPLSARDWRDRPGALWPVIEEAHASLAAEHDLLVIEGAGSPAEINLLDTDLSNMRTAALADARVLLVADIERGGALAHLYGTWALLAPEDRERLEGFVLNKFRGDPGLLAPAPEMLRERTGVPVLAVVPRIDHGLPDEDGAATPELRGEGPRVAVVRYPAASNLDEFKVLEDVADVCWARAPRDLRGADLVVLPGSKSVASDLGWLRATGLAEAIAATPARVLGICGGLQMLGHAVDDPGGVEGAATGLGLLPVRTRMATDKTTRHRRARFGALPAPWRPLAGLEVEGYEIHHGVSAGAAGGGAVLEPDLAWADGRFLGVYLHGLFEASSFARAVLGVASAAGLEARLDALADRVGEHLDVDALLARAA